MKLSSQESTIEQPKKNTFFYVILALVVVVIWGANFVVAENAVSQIPPFLLVAMRYFVVALVFLPFTRRNGLPWKYIFLVGFFYGVVQFSGLFWGLSLGVSSGIAATLIQSQALFTILLATLFLNEKFSLLQWLGLVAGVIGLILITVSGDISAPIPGVLCIIFGGAGWACSNIVLKKAGKISAWTMTVWQSITVVPIMLLLSIIFESNHYASLANISLSAISSVLYIALVATGLGNFLWYYLVQKLGPSNTAPFSLLIPVVAVITGWIVLGEKLTLLQTYGVLIILAGLVLIQLSAHLKSRFKSIKTKTVVENSLKSSVAEN